MEKSEKIFYYFLYKHFQGNVLQELYNIFFRKNPLTIKCMEFFFFENKFSVDIFRLKYVFMIYEFCDMKP